MTGGAEIQARQIAEGLAGRGHAIDVLTTTARSPADDWGTNHFDAGAIEEDGVTVRRFRVDRRDRDAFDRANTYFLSQPVTSRRTMLPEEHTSAFVNDNINSHELLAHLSDRGADYDAIVFLPYLYGPTLRGVPLVADRAWLQPCLHHECYALVPQVSTIFHDAKGVLFNSDGERALALRLYGPGLHGKSRVVGQWVDVSVGASNGASRIGSFAPAQERYILYVGRRDETKNVGLLIESFRLYRRQDYSTSLKLVLVGPGTTNYHDPAHGIFDLGQVTDGQRDALLGATLALFQPSYNESFSRVVMEAWSVKRPVAVNSQCISTALAVERSEGGWTAASKAEWATLMRTIDRAEPAVLAAAGARGHAYYRANATPAAVLDRYEDVLWGNAAFRAEGSAPLAISVPSLNLNDELVRRGLTLADWARDAGCTARLWVDGSKTDEAPSGASLFVHSPLPQDLARALAWPGDVTLAYDAQRYSAAEDQLVRLVPRCRLTLARSRDEADDLHRAGAVAIEQWPFEFSLRCWDVVPDPKLSRRLGDGTTNCLFAGPFVSQSCCEQLIAAFAFLVAIEVDARLLLAGVPEDEKYAATLRKLIVEHNLADRVWFVDPADSPALAAAYSEASIFWTMSEGFEPRVPLVDAMWFDVPILAFSTPTTREILGRGGLLFNRKEELVLVAALAKQLIRDSTLRGAVLDAQEGQRRGLTREPPEGAQLVVEMLARGALAHTS